MVLAEDESHLVWGDTLGRVWGQRNARTEVPIVNAKQRQTYYGVMNILTQEVTLAPFVSGNGENTIAFLKHLQALHSHQKLILLWDGASDHRSDEVQRYLSHVNQSLEEPDWKVTGLLLAPHALDQNPMEDVWLQGKNFLRKHFYENKTFHQVKHNFFDFLNKRIFNFTKPNWYLENIQTE